MGRRITPALAIAAGASMLLLSACATSQFTPSPAARGEMFAYAPAPAQFTAFCARNPNQCKGMEIGSVAAAAPATYRPASRSGVPPQNYNRFDWSQAFALPDEPVQISYAPPHGRMLSKSAVVRHLIEVNTDVNQSVRFRSDDQLFGTDDYWALPVKTKDGLLMGDCEDYALMKRSVLLAEGFSPDSLSLAVVRTARGDVHAVLLVATDEGEMVLDSLTPIVGTWKQSRYALIARQAAGNAKTWIQPA
jgi:predicted transglutaminase-like cysteine proteinase